MIQKKDIPFVAGRFSVGDKIKVEKRWSDQRVEKVYVTIVGKYPQHCLVSDGKMKWCIKWVDFIIQNIQR